MIDIPGCSERTNFKSQRPGLTNASVEIEGYKLHRLDRIGKSGAGVFALYQS
jgi:hypothetical protein